jgi:hypothetical protein
LPDLIRLRFSIDCLQVQLFGDRRVRVDVMTSLDSPKLEFERLNEALQIAEGDIPKMASSNPREQSFWFHPTNILSRLVRAPLALRRGEAGALQRPAARRREEKKEDGDPLHGKRAIVSGSSEQRSMAAGYGC